MDGRIDRASPLGCCWILSVEVLKMSLYSMQGSIAQLLLQTCEHCLILADVVDHGHHDGEGVLPRLQCHIGSSELKENENLFLVSNDPSLPNWEDIGGDRGHGEAEGDSPLQLALGHQLRLHLKPHQLDDVL